VEATPRFLRGVHPFKGSGYDKPTPVDAELTFIVPSDKRAQLIYWRAGNSSNELKYLVLLSAGKTMRYFPIGAKASQPGTKIEVLLAAPAETSGHLVLDIGLLEI
jgi:assimilatory nitrate reductase catalytic subunit